MWGPDVSDRKERRRCCPLMRETYSEGTKGAWAYQAGWARRGLGRGSGLVRASLVGWARPRRFEFQMNLDFGRTFRNFTRRFRRNLDMRMFPKFL
jgi:hypothetical protein